MKKSYFTRKEQIILSTIELIDELGINNLSIHEIAKKENITEGALYRHFRSKEEIIIESLRYYSHFDINIINTINKNNLGSRASIVSLLTSLSEYYENYPEITSLYCSFESLIYEQNIGKEVLLIMENRSDFLILLIENGKKSKEFKDGINSEDMANIILGSFRHLVFKWRIEKHEFSLKKKALDMLNLILGTC